MPENEAPRPPRDLRASGKRLWSSIVDELDLDEHELALLRAACRTVDALERIAGEMQGAPLTVTNSRGDEIANPVLVEHRQQSAQLARTLASLRLPSGLADDSELARPQRRGAARRAYGIRGSVG